VCLRMSMCVACARGMCINACACTRKVTVVQRDESSVKEGGGGTTHPIPVVKLFSAAGSALSTASDMAMKPPW
jgi:hypothetical protein